MSIITSIQSGLSNFVELFRVYFSVLLSYLQPFFSKIVEGFTVYVTVVFWRFLELIEAPRTYPEMIWILTPLLLTMFLMEFYFARYKEELLGWNTAFGNSLVLMFVSIDLIRHLYNDGKLLLLTTNNIIVLGIIVLGLFLMLVSFFHLLPPRFAFNISSKLLINFLACFAVVAVYSDMVVDLYTISAMVLLFVCLFLFVKLVDLIMPGVPGELTKEAPKPSEGLKEVSEEGVESEEEVGEEGIESEEEIGKEEIESSEKESEGSEEESYY